MNEIIRSIEQKQLRTDLPKISIGDTVRVWVKVVEGSRERLQAFEGVVIAMRNGGVRSAAFPMALAWSVRSPCILPAWIMWKSSAAVKCAARSCTTCAICRARRPSLRKLSACKTEGKKSSVFPVWEDGAFLLLEFSNEHFKGATFTLWTCNFYP